MKRLLFLAAFACSSFVYAQSPVQANTRAGAPIGGACEGCEAVYESPEPFAALNWRDTLPDFSEEGPKLLVQGIVFQKDGKQPAKDVVLYVYHTDQAGLYPTKGNESGWARRHGYLRGWIKTDAQGHYAFYTLKPAPYPGGNAPAHIHITVKEPDKNEYWIDEYLFADDPLLPKGSHLERGGSGIVRLHQKNGMWVGERNILLGKNIPNYP